MEFVQRFVLYFHRCRRYSYPRSGISFSCRAEHLSYANEQPERAYLLKYAKICRLSHKHISQGNSVFYDIYYALCFCELFSCTVSS